MLKPMESLIIQLHQIARKVGDIYELDLTLRNNITTEEHPLGVYHPHAEYHHIKKENIGLIEVMGLAVLPARLKGEMELLEEYILEGKDISSNEQIEKHAEWVKKFLPKYPEITKENIHGILQKEIGIVFTHVLEDAGVYKCTTEGREAFMRFLETLIKTEIKGFLGKWEVSETSHFFRAATLKKHGSGSCIIRKYGIAGIPWGVLLCRESI